MHGLVGRVRHDLHVLHRRAHFRRLSPQSELFPQNTAQSAAPKSQPVCWRKLVYERHFLLGSRRYVQLLSLRACSLSAAATSSATWRSCAAASARGASP